jgi:hypothetical protein
MSESSNPPAPITKYVAIAIIPPSALERHLRERDGEHSP